MSDQGWSPSEAAPAFRSPLYRQPRLYDLVFPDHADTTGQLVHTALRRYLPGVARSMLDVGCGTGSTPRDAGRDHPGVFGCGSFGIEHHLRQIGPRGHHVRPADMRTVRLGRCPLDLLTCLGNALSYALSDAELTGTVSSFALMPMRGRCSWWICSMRTPI